MPAAPLARRSGTAFTVLVAIAMFLGACVMALVLVLSHAPGALVIGVLLAALPVGPLIACYVWLDRYEPEPRTLLLLGLGWGAFVATSTALVLQIAGEFAFKAPASFSAAVLAPLTEEAAKGLFILLLLFFRRHELDGILDGIVYAGMVGIGFAFTENILYLSSAYLGQDGQPGGISGAVGLFVVRGVFSPFAHPLFTSFTGIGIGIAVSSRKPAVRFLAPLLGYVLAVGAHAAWNGSLFMRGGQSFGLTYVFVMVPGFLLITGFAIWARRRESKVLAEALSDCAGRGFIKPAEIPWLVRLPARRAARRNALAVGGKDARDAMAGYQQQAIELGFMHYRFLRGTAPKDFAVRGQSFVDSMAALRPALVWPTNAGTNAPTAAVPNTGGG
ncbi:MAG: PrsW family intramembrane metalloprotease [Marmoricola sp.]